MFINPIHAVSDTAPQVARKTVQKASKQINTFFSAHTPIGVVEGQDNIIISKAASGMSYARILEAPKAEIEKITSIFW